MIKNSLVRRTGSYGEHLTIRIGNCEKVFTMEDRQSASGRPYQEYRYEKKIVRKVGSCE